MKIPKSIVLQMALFTITGMPLVAILLDHFSERVNLRQALIGYEAIWKQVSFGVFAGFLIAILAQLLISSAFLKNENTEYVNLLGRFKLSLNEIVFVSLCAGVGEEILFRGALQPIFGVLATSVIFVAIHGYLNPKNWRISVYGLYMTIAIVGIGYMAEYLGLISAILAHTIIDIYLLKQLQKNAGKVAVTENEHLSDNSADEADENMEF